MVNDSTAFSFYFLVSSNNGCLQKNAIEVGNVAHSILSMRGDMQKRIQLI